LTRGLGDAEARMLVEWLVEEADRRATGADGEDATAREVQRLCRWARGISRFVQLWCYRETRAGALQLAASERYQWPLPATWMEPCELMECILAWQTGEVANR
jgi:hypothetical protein